MTPEVYEFHVLASRHIDNGPVEKIKLAIAVSVATSVYDVTPTTFFDAVY